MGLTDRALDRRQLVLLLILSTVFLLPVLFQPNALIYPTYATHSDLATIHWPKATLLAESVRHHGQWALWTPRILSGMPLAANPLAMAFYPPSLLFLLLPVGMAFNLLWGFHLWLASAGVYWWLRRVMGVSAPAALLGGLTFAFTGKMAAHMAAGHVSLIGAVAWLPWVLYFADQALARRDLLAALLAGLALALQATTHSQMFLYTAYLALAYGLVKLVLPGVSVSSGNRTQGMRLLLLIFVAAGLLGAVQLLPLTEMAPLSNRVLSAEEASAQALTPAQLVVSLLLPTSQGGHEPVIYLGLVPCLLIPFARVHRDRWRVLFFAGLGVFALILALGDATPLYALLRWLPGLGYTRTPVRVGFLLALAVATLAACGFDTLVSAAWTDTSQRRWRLAAVSIAAAGLIAGAGLALVTGTVSRATWGLAVFPALGAGVILMSQRFASRRLPILFLGLGALLLADLWSFDRTLWRVVSPEEAFAPGAEVSTWLAAQPGQFRVYSPGYAIQQQVAAEHSLELADGVEPVHLAAYDRYASVATGVPIEGFSVTVPPFPAEADLATAHRDALPNLKLLGLLNVRYLVAAFDVRGEGLVERARFGEVRVFENPHALPRAFVVGQTERVGDQAEVLSQLLALDPRQVAVVEDGPPLTGGTMFREATVLRHSPNRIEVQVDLDKPGFLILSEVWYPGWQATADGELLQVFRAAGLLRGVYLAPGSHRVTFTYQPLSVRVGGAVSAVSLGTLLALWGWLGVRQRRQTAGPFRNGGMSRTAKQ